jgi:hypothetical protein
MDTLNSNSILLISATGGPDRLVYQMTSDNYKPSDLKGIEVTEEISNIEFELRESIKVTYNENRIITKAHLYGT